MNRSARRASGRSDNQPVGRWIRPWRRLAIYLRDRFRCVHCMCDLSMAEPREVTLDHVTPRGRHRGAKGGPNRTSNLVTSCMDCNRLRDDKSLAAFYPLLPVPGGPYWDRRGYVTHVKLAAARSIAPHVAMAKALTSDKPWPEAHLHAREHAAKQR